jgi:hypothetical protein
MKKNGIEKKEPDQMKKKKKHGTTEALGMGLS